MGGVFWGLNKSLIVQKLKVFMFEKCVMEAFKPLGNNAYICKYTVPENATGVSLRINESTANLAGNTVGEGLTYGGVIVGIPETAPGRTSLQPETEAEAARKARLLMTWIQFELVTYLSRTRRIWGAEAREIWDQMISNRVGISNKLQLTLYYILLDESPHGVPEEFRGSSKWFPTAAYEDLRLRFLHPEKSEQELVELYRQSAEAGKIKIVSLIG